ncbi:MAG: zinc ribbon domain-containing protein [Nanoarchaeota archaeon]|nr:zinc ribbon domain-containing protein [Nanoarchaeota archaeon]
MKCPKCEKETDDHSKFCSSCGEKVEERSSVVQLEDMTKTCAKVWYIAGFMRGATSDTKKDKKILENFEKLLRENNGEMWEWYQEIVAYWKEWAKKNDEKDKKANGSKRVRVPKVEGNKIQQK